ncbi:MAG: hypothetical protein ACREK5_00085 [Gemmatimonadota bacterium]
MRGAGDQILHVRVPESFATSALVLGVAALCASCNGGTSGPDPIPVPGICNLQPNYVSEVQLNRWRDFPLRYSLIDSTFSNENRDLALNRIIEGIHEWSVSTNARIGSVVQIRNTDEADLVILAENLGPRLQARATHATGTPFLSGGRIIFNQETVVEFSRVDGGGPIATLAAHEMGHHLGIIGHISTQGNLMSTSTLAPGPTAADINTLLHAYCRP